MLEVKRVLQRKDGVKMVIIPKNSKIKEGDLVLITNKLSLIDKFSKEDKDGKNRRT